MNKKTLIGVFLLALVFSVSPRITHANGILDPFNLFGKDTPAVVNNTNSNNVNSNVNSPGATVGSTAPVVTGSGTGRTYRPGVVITPVVYNPPVVYNYPSYLYNDNSYNYNNNYQYPTYSYQGPLSASCYANVTYAPINSSVTWQVSANGGNGTYSFTWDGTDGLYGTGSNIYRTYSYVGIKSAVVTVYSNGQSIRINCGNTVTIQDGSYYPYYNSNYNNGYSNGNYYDNGPLSVTCAPTATFAAVGEEVTWTAVVPGASNNYAYSWTGNDNLRGNSQSINVRYSATGPKQATVTVRSNGRIATQTCGTLTVGAPIAGYSGYQANGTTNNYYGQRTAQNQNQVTRRASTQSPTASPSATANANSSQGAAAFLALNNVPWAWVAVIVIFVLFGTVMYLLFNKSKI